MFLGVTHLKEIDFVNNAVLPLIVDTTLKDQQPRWVLSSVLNEGGDTVATRHKEAIEYEPGGAAAGEMGQDLALNCASRLGIVGVDTVGVDRFIFAWIE